MQDSYINHRRVWVTATWVIFGTLVGQLAALGVVALFGIDIQEATRDLSVVPPLALALMIATTQLISYLLPGLIAAWTLFKGRWLKAVRAVPLPTFKQLIIGLTAFGLCLPLTAALAELNASIELSGWQLDIETNVAETLSAIIKGEGLSGLLLALTIVAVLPALGEELVFRGLIQPGLVRLTGHPHVGVWLTAFAFGLVHFQFAGLLPRVFLGATLGFLAYYSQRLWLPILAHFLFNGIQVIALRADLIESELPDKTVLDIDSLIRLGIGLVGVGLAAYLFPKLREAGEEPDYFEDNSVAEP